jgi:EmrB/QacA subfamily drug resistance transporter
LILAIVCLGQFMVVLDISVVNVALPSIKADLGFSTIDLEWVVNAYTLTFAGFLLLGGRAADLFGRRRIFLLGLGLFTTASFVGGLAPNQATLIIARALQGFGGAVLAPATLTILTTSFSEGPIRARALGVWSAVAAAGASAGALLGGILTDTLTWRWILFVNIPIGLIALIAARAFLPESRSEAGHRSLDLVGALTVTAGLTAVVYAIVRTGTYSWVAWQTLLPMLVGVALLALFVVAEARLVSAPLIPLSIFRSRSVTGGNLFMLLLFAAMFGSWYFETLYMQRVLGYTPLQAGLAFLPQTLSTAAGAQVTSRLVNRFGPRPLLITAPLMAAIGFLWLAQLSPDSAFLSDLLGPSILAGLGVGLSVTPVTVAATSGVERDKAGLASGLLNTSRIVGAAIGLAALASIAQARTTSLLGANTTPAGALGALTSGYSLGFIIGAFVLVFASMLASILIPSNRTSSL